MWTTTAIHNSARFQLASPAGVVLTDEEEPRSVGHVIDGGYFDNFGATTLSQVIEATMRILNRDDDAASFFPVIIQISSDPGLKGGDLVRAQRFAVETGPLEPGPTDSPNSPAYLVSELLAPFRGMLARGIMATHELAGFAGCEQESTAAKGVFVHFAMSETANSEQASAPPLGWAMDAASRTKIDRQLDAPCNAGELERLKRWLDGH